MILVTANEMQQMDRLTIESFGIPGRVLMENAGRGATRFFLKQFPDLKAQRVAVVAGRGNNGGDGFVIARYLAQAGITTIVYLLAVRDQVKGDAAANLKLLSLLEIEVVEIPDENSFSIHRPAMRKADIWVDAILGTGLKSDVRGYFRTVIDFINELDKPVFSVDIPSGLDSETGRERGTCIRARATATFGFAKPGHLIYPGADCTGTLDIVDIGIPPYIAKSVGPRQFLLTADRIASSFSNRAPDAHKGTNGHLLIIAGSLGKTGAAMMASLSALRTGAGLVTLGIARSLNAILETRLPEVMTAPLPETGEGILGDSAFETVQELAGGKKCLAIGPGLGQAAETRELVLRLIEESRLPMVIDADGLNNLAGRTEILKTARAPIVLTPHPGEMARLLDTSVTAIQQDRIACARNTAMDFNVHIVLKGARTVIAHPDGRIFINPTGNAGMASGGMGDVLTGIIAGLMTQGFSAESASQAGPYLHGAAADSLAQSTGPYGYLASEVMHAVPAEIGKILDHK